MIRRMTQLIFLMIFVSTFFQALPAQEGFTPPPGSPLAKKEHPRLFFTKESIGPIKSYIDRYEGENFQRYVNEVDAAFEQSAAAKERNMLLLDAHNFAFLCYARASGLFENYSFAHSAGEYAAKAYEHAVEIDRQKRLPRKWLKEQSHAAIMESPSQGGYINLALGTVYDWCYDQLSLEQKRFLADALYICFQKRDDEVNPRDKAKLGLTLTSQSHDVGIGGLAIWGDPLGEGYAAIAQEMLDGVQWLWYDRILRMGEQLFEGTAGWSEGANYFSGAMTNLIWYVAALSTAVNDNLFERFRWLHDVPLYSYFYAMPMPLEGEFPGYYVQRNDAASLREWDSMGTLRQITPIAAHLKSSDPTYAGFCQWIVEDSRMKIVEYAYEREDPRVMWLFYKFLWGTADIVHQTPDAAGIGTSYRFGLGDAIFLSDLHSDEATKINFYTPKYHLSRHYNKDNSSFTVFKYGTLALDAGVSKGDSNLPKTDKTSNPIFHNLLAFYRPGGSPYYNYDMDTKDRADSYVDADNHPGGKNHVGDVLAQRFQPGRFDFIDYDYTRSYKGEDYPRRLRRKLLYLRDPAAPGYRDHEYLLIFDDALVSDSTLVKRWLLQTTVMPRLLDGHWEDQGKGFWTADKGSLLEVTNTLFNAHGRMFVKILAPASYRLRLRGGSEGNQHYWFTDANGEILGERGPYNDLGAFWAGTHRLEIEDASGDTLSQYLVVMQIGDANTMAKMAPLEPVEAGDFTGALINQDRLALFNRSGQAQSAVTYRFSATREVWHIITGLAPGRYRISRNGKAEKTVAVGEDGVLYIELPGGGTFVVEPE